MLRLMLYKIMMSVMNFLPYSNLKSTNTTVCNVSVLEVNNWNYSYTNDNVIIFLQFQCISAYLKMIDHSNHRPLT